MGLFGRHSAVQSIEKHQIGIVDFNDYQQNERMYGGLSGAKIGIEYQGENYLLKFPKNLKEANMKNVTLSYSNSPVCEYLGSHIYGLLDIPVHETILGTRRDKTVVACKDFLQRGDRLYEFREIKTTFEPHFTDDTGEATSGNGTDLDEVLRTINEHPLLQKLPKVKERFWDMFVVDAYIGNSDRNNGNWGIISRYDGTMELAPVYDNGGCLNNKWDDAKMDRLLVDFNLLQAQAFTGVVCIFTKNEKRINPFQYMRETSDRDCLHSIKKNIPTLKSKQKEILALIQDNPVLSDIQKKFYTHILDLRLKLALTPIYEKHFPAIKEAAR